MSEALHILFLSLIKPLSSGVLVCRNKVPQTGQLKQEKRIVSPFWRPEVRGQGVGRAMLPRKGLEKGMVQSSLLASGGSLAYAA